jgi:pSer/pThr/pTyr-binding forkhead associated (FHA) protein
MPAVTFQVLEGIDKGRVFRDLSTPVTIGREEGNLLRLNDERVSRYHAKVQYDNGEVILTDLESTNGTRVNGTVVSIRRLKAGDQIGVGRSILLFGSEQEIVARMATLGNAAAPVPVEDATNPVPQTVHADWPRLLAAEMEQNLSFDVKVDDKVTLNNGTLYLGSRALPPLPQKLSPSQAARLSELLDFLHRLLTLATENIRASDDGTQVTLAFADWQRILGLQMLLARYVRAVSEPDALEE